MKKMKLGTIFLALLLSMLLVSCGGTPEEKVQAYVEKALTTPEMKEAKVQSEADGIELTLIAESTSLTYQYKYIANIDDLGGAELVKANIEKTMSDPTRVVAQQAALEGVKEQCPEITSVKYQYYDNQGNLLTSREFK